jgi:hypothetical protein
MQPSTDKEKADHEDRKNQPLKKGHPKWKRPKLV